VEQAAPDGYEGHVDVEFTLKRDGSFSKTRMLKSSGADAQDQAARDAVPGGTLRSG